MSSPGSGSWGWNRGAGSLPVANIEQQTASTTRITPRRTPDYAPNNIGPNTTVTFTLISTMLCPSDNQRQRQLSVGADELLWMLRGPSAIRWQSGMIVDMFTCST